MFLRGTFERFAHGDNFAGRFAAGDGPGMRGAHHNPLKHGLSADQSFFPTFEGREKLYRGQESQIISESSHEGLDAPNRDTTQALG